MSGANLTGLLDGPSRWLADHPAIVVGERPVRTWGELGEAVAARATALRDRYAVRPGDRVALFAGNCPEYLEVLFAIWHAGGVAVPINARLHSKEAAALLESSAAKVCFATAGVADAIERDAPAQTPVALIEPLVDAGADGSGADGGGRALRDR